MQAIRQICADAPVCTCSFFNLFQVDYIKQFPSSKVLTTDEPLCNRDYQEEIISGQKNKRYYVEHF